MTPDVDECSRNSRLCMKDGEFCHNIPGSYECLCRPDYYMDISGCIYGKPLFKIYNFPVIYVKLSLKTFLFSQLRSVVLRRSSSQPFIVDYSFKKFFQSFSLDLNCSSRNISAQSFVANCSSEVISA